LKVAVIVAVSAASLLTAPDYTWAQDESFAPKEAQAIPTALPKMSAREREVWEQEEAYWRDLKTHDKRAFLSLWHEQFVGWPRVELAPIQKDQIALQPNMRRRFLEYKLEPLSVREYGDNLVVTFYRCTARSTDENGGDEQTQSTRLTHTWMKTAQGWQIIGGMGSQDNLDPQLSTLTLHAAPAAEQQILRVEEERRQAVLGNDIKALDSLIAPEYTAVFNLFGGKVTTRADELALNQPDARKVESWSPTDVNVRIYDNVGLVVGLAEIIDVLNADRRHIRVRYTHVWVKRNGTWRLVHRHTTRVATLEGPEPPR
jgi:ketosteroid isomerase-like protein